jgi:dTDP-4-dehydrorhamnose 3,5-epimerase
VIYSELEIPGAFRIIPEQHGDERGFFARSWDRDEFARHGLNPTLVQCSISWNKRAGTLRGMHYQDPPFQEAKLVRVTRGSVHDVVLDLREGSPTYGRHAGVLLTSDNREMVYVPEGCGHGFLTLEDDTEVFYQMSEYYSAEHARGVRWDDPAFAIRWPGTISVMSDRDRSFPDVKAGLR